MAKTNGIYLALICGHGLSDSGSWDSGCVYRKNGKLYTEADLMLKITRAAVKYAKQCGFKVYSDESSNNNANMNKCIREANKRKVDAYISFHCDYSGAPTGLYPYYYKTSKDGKRLADCLENAVMKDLGIKTRGLHSSTDLGEVASTNMPSCIFECGSIKKDFKLMNNKYDEYGKAIVKGICKYFGVKFVEKNNTNSTIKKTFKVVPKMNLKIRVGVSTSSKVVKDVCKKGTEYTIVEVNEKGNRGKLKSGLGWITITSKYVERV